MAGSLNIYKLDESQFPPRQVSHNDTRPAAAHSILGARVRNNVALI